MPTIIRRRKLGLKSIKGIIEASTSAILTYANNYEYIPHNDVYIRWGCTSSLPNKEARVVNSANSIHRISNKSGFRHQMMEHGLCPETWWSTEEWAHWGKTLPVIVRTKTHAQGRGMWVCNTEAELFAALDQAGPGYYINKLIDKVAEFRVFVCQGRVVWVAQKTPANADEVAWNVAKGGRFDNVRWGDWNMNVINNALEVWELTKAHFAGIDVMLDGDGTAWCVEANSAPSQTSPYRQSCVAKAFDWMQGKDDYSRAALRLDGLRAKTWKQAIHPALTQE